MKAELVGQLVANLIKYTEMQDLIKYYFCINSYLGVTNYINICFEIHDYMTKVYKNKNVKIQYPITEEKIKCAYLEIVNWFEDYKNNK